GILMVGSTNLCTKAIGKGDKEGLTCVFSLTITLGVLLSAFLAVSGVCAPGVFASLFGAKGASAEVFSDTARYLRGLFLGAPGFNLYVVLTPILQLDGDMLRPKIASLACAVTDVAGDLLNLFVFRGGIFGMALASSISHYAAFLIVASHFLKKGSLFHFSLRAVHDKLCGPLLTDGLPRAMSMLGRGILPVLLNALLLRLVGDPGVTALSAMINTSFIIGALGWGIGGAVLIMGGMMVGEQDVTGMKNVIKTALGDILAGVSALAAAVFLCAPYIAALFIPQGGEAQRMALTVIRCYAVCLPFLAFNVSAGNYLQVVSRTLGANLVNICIEVACTAAAAYLLSPFLGVLGVWLAYPAGQAVLSLIIVLRVILVKDGSRKGVEAHMLLKEGFGIPEEDRIERSLHTMEEVVSLSSQVIPFCVERRIGTREANRLALCVEEMAGNVIEHGFSDGKPHHLDVRVLVKDGSVILRLRDDCRRFDLREKVQNWKFDPEHPEKNIGIRMVLRVAKDISYTNTMNTNNLIITV
ncbi:MAG: ATP-binding protein, partial [Abditibacteriota bacterium]|nr:ATP-binding protein [Abditibacteriota bacterium]